MTAAETLKNIIESRKSLRPKDYEHGDIPQEILDEILNASNFAPHHKKTFPWRFRVFQGEEKNRLAQELSKIYTETTPPEKFLEKRQQDIVAQVDSAAAVVTICVNFSGLVPEWEEIAATAMAVQNMYLTANVHDVGCYWSSPGLINHLDSFLDLAENQKCYGLFYMGMKRKENG